MTTRHTLTASIIVTAILFAFTFTAAQDGRRRPAPPQPAEGPRNTITEVLGGADRYHTHIQTDKPIYRPGERAYIRATILHAANRTPLGQHQQINGMIEIKGPRGETISSGHVSSQDSVMGLTWDVPEEQAGGQYTIRVTHPWTGHAPAERQIEVRAFRAPRLRSQIVFVRDGYGPGDTVSVSASITRAEGGIPAGAKVTVVARVDGTEVHRGTTTISKAGVCSAQFKLPDQIAVGDGTLAFVIEDGGTVETASKSIPILMQTVDLTFYPEGGDLMRGMAQRVYFEAKQPNGKPADIAGEIVDEAGKVVATFKTEHEGRGLLHLPASASDTFSARIMQPTGIKTTYELKASRDVAVVVLTSPNPVYAPGRPVEVYLNTYIIDGIDEREFKVTLSKREQVLATQTIEAVAMDRRGARPAGVHGHRLAFNLPAEIDGVLTVTVFDKAGKPLAERLVYRQPARNLRISITADQSRYTPGGKAKLTIKAVNEKGEPVEAVVGVTVTDDSVQEMIEKREQAPRLPVMVMLEPEVKELADAHVYLNPDDAKAPQALDLLLGTQGWRRFAMVDTVKFMKDHGDAARRVLALRVPVAPPAMPAGAMLRAMDLGLDVDAVQEGAALPRDGMLPDDMAKRDEVVHADPKADAAPVADRDELIQAAGELERARRRPWAAGQAVMGDARDAEIGMDARMQQAANQFVIVREYAHRAQPDRVPGQRIDFTDTLYWNVAARTDARTGQATVEFELSDLVTSFRVFADAFDDRGALGGATTEVESVRPFWIEPKFPLEVTVGDRIDLPVVLINTTDKPLSNMHLSGLGAIKDQFLAPLTIGLGADARQRSIMSFNAPAIGDHPLIIAARPAEGIGPSDQVTRTISVRPNGFPIEVARGGMIDADSSNHWTVDIPEDLVAGSLTAKLAVYPTPLANLTEALSALMREPYGCFEQTSSTSYPLVMAQQYFTSHAGVDPKLVQRSGELLDRAYARLVSFECKEKGYEWFGGTAPGHEALTAYGLMQFIDMAQVRQVDREMIDRTRNWLLARRDGKGGFQRNQRALDSFGGAPTDTTNAYIVWSLMEANETGLQKEIAQVRDTARQSNDSYILALAANVMAMSGDEAQYKAFAAKLAAKQQKDGHVAGGVTTITRSGGDALKIETTALATLAWLRDRDYANNVEHAIRFLADNCRAGRYGSTQSTILSLRAIVLYDQQRASPKTPGELAVFVDGVQVGEAIAFDTESQGALVLPDMTSMLTAGKRTIELRMTEGSEMPFAFALTYNSPQPASSDACALRIETKLGNATIKEGDITEATVTVKNVSGKDAPMPVAIVGIPGGLEVRHDQLKEMVKAGRIDAYEVLGRNVVLYWRQFKQDQTTTIPLSLVAAVPGKYTGPASRAYLYYTDELKQWSPAMVVEIHAVK